MSTTARFCHSLPILTAMLLFQPSGYLNAGTTTIDFEGAPDSTVLTNEYAGLTFQNTIVLTAGISLNEFEFPPRSGVNVVSDNSGPITINFDSPVISVNGHFTYLTLLTFTAFDVGDNQVGQVQSAFSSNLALSGDPGSVPNELLQLGFAGGIARVTILGDSNGGSFTLDDFAYTSGAADIPEPGTLPLILTAAGVFALCRRRKS